MKAVQQLSICLWLLVIFALVSCTKNETITPTHGPDFSIKNAPELIDSRAEYELLNQYPSFIGGDSLFREYLQTHINYPQEAIENNISGRVFASFIIENNGVISNLEILKGIGYGCDEEVFNALENMPSWSAGKIADNYVRVKLVIPIEFQKEP